MALSNISIINKFKNEHPILHFVAEDVKKCRMLNEFIMFKLGNGIASIPPTLCTLCLEYFDYLVVRYTPSESSMVASRRTRWITDKLALVAWLHKVQKRDLNFSLIQLLLEDQRQKEGGMDIEGASCGLIHPVRSAKSGLYEFKPSWMEDFCVAYYHFHQFLANVDELGLRRSLYSCRPSVRLMPITADAWQLTFGLLNIDPRVATSKHVLLKDLIYYLQKTLNMSASDVTIFTIFSLYESQNPNGLLELLDEFLDNQAVNLSDLDMSAEKKPYFLTCIGYLIRASEQIYAVKLSNCGLNGKHLQSLVGPITDMTDSSLQVLNLSNNELGPRGLLGVQHFLATATNLTALDLSSCYLTDNGAQLLSNFFECITLTHLNLSNNYISGMGLQHMVENFKYCTYLRWLDLSNNLITDVGADQLAIGLPLLKELKVLNLRKNLLTEPGITAIVDSLCQLPSFPFVDLDENTYGTGWKDYIEIRLGEKDKTQKILRNWLQLKKQKKSKGRKGLGAGVVPQLEIWQFG